MLQNELSSQQLNQSFSDTTTNQLRPLRQDELKDSFQDTDGGWLKQDFRDSLNPMPLEPTANPMAVPTPAAKTFEN